MRIKFILLIFVIIILNLPFYAQTDTSKVKWQSFDTIKNSFEKYQKPVLIYFHDVKNDSSNLMLNSTFGLFEVANYINILFYPIKMDVYSTDTITFFDGKSYTNSGKNGKIHDIVVNLLGKETTIPSMVLFTKNAIGTVYQGFKNRNQIFPLLIYYAESINAATTYENFEKYYFRTYPPGQQQIMTRVLVKWKGLEEAFELNKTKPKKILVNLYENYSISSTMQRLKTYNDPIISEYLNKNFYCTNLNVKSRDTISFFNQKYINKGVSHGYHQLAIAMLNGKMVFPSFLIFDEKSKLIDRFQTYMIPEDFEVLIKFIGEGAFKNQKWEKYKNSFKSSFKEEKTSP